jgi:voltage-gated potassium channel
MLENSGVLTFGDAASCLLALLSVMVYVISTYDRDESNRDTFLTIDFTLSVIFSAHYLGGLWLSESRSTFLWHYQSVVDVVTIIPGYVEFFAQTGAGATFLFLRVLRMIR